MNTANTCMLNFDGYENVVVYRHGHWNYRRREEVAVKVRVCLLLHFAKVVISGPSNFMVTRGLKQPS